MRGSVKRIFQFSSTRFCRSRKCCCCVPDVRSIESFKKRYRNLHEESQTVLESFLRDSGTKICKTRDRWLISLLWAFSRFYSPFRTNLDFIDFDGFSAHESQTAGLWKSKSPSTTTARCFLRGFLKLSIERTSGTQQQHFRDRQKLVVESWKIPSKKARNY